MIVICGEQVGKTYLDRCADHTEGCNTAELCILDLNRLALAVPAYHSAGAGNDYLHAFFKIASAAYDILDLVSDIYLAYTELVSIGMGLYFFDYTD